MPRIRAAPCNVFRVPRSLLVTLFSRTNLASLCVAALLAQVNVAQAQSPNCAPGRNILDELKTSEPAVYAAIRKAADAQENAKHVLWKIEHKDFPNRGVSYLFGTIHLTDERVQILPPAAAAAVENARRIGVEVEDLTQERMAEAMTTMSGSGGLLLPGKERLDSLLSATEKQHTTQALAKSGLPPEMLARVRPWVALVMMATTDCERSRLRAGKLPLDGELARSAEARGIGAVGLETVELQFKAMADIPHADQLALLKAQLAIAPRMHDMVETLVQLYLARDFGAIWPLQIALAQKAGVDPKAFESYEEHLLVVRNKSMRDRAYMHVERGGIFMAVGALHLPGKFGLVNLFREMGYDVTPVE
jgi:uncharacterized protein